MKCLRSDWIEFGFEGYEKESKILIFQSIRFLLPTISPSLLLTHEITNKFSFLADAYTIPMELANFSWHFSSDDVQCVCVLAYSRFPMHHRSSIPVELRKWECVPMCASTDRQRAKEKKIVAVFFFFVVSFFFVFCLIFLRLRFWFESFFSVCRAKKSEDKQWLRPSISIANMCQPAID